jgi:ABC-type glycerol-3-phosphate transport system substrate-binding protein
MKLSNKALRLSALGIACLFMLTACGLNPLGNRNANQGVTIPSTPITLEVWRLWDSSDILDQNIASYQEKHPNVNVVVQKVEIGPNETIYDYQSRIIKLLADNKGADIFEIHNDWLSYQINQIEPMPQSLMTLDQYNDIYPKVVVDDFTKDGKIYAVPMYMDNLMLFYNPDLLSEAKVKVPKTWQDLVNIVPRLTKTQNGQITQSAIALGVGPAQIPRFAEILATLMAQNGAQMTDANRAQATFDLPLSNDPTITPGAEALEFYSSFANPATSNYTYTDRKNRDGSLSLPSDVQAFIEGKSAMMVGYAYQINNIKQFNPRFYFETAPLPQVNLESPKVIANYWGLSVAKNSQYPQVAWDFINFLQSERQQSTYTRNAKRVSARKDLRDNYAGDQLYGTVATQMDYTFSWYRQNTPKVEEIFANMVDSVIHANIDAKTAVRTAVQTINALS